MNIRATLLATTIALLVTPAAAQAWIVTVHVHGAGTVTETTARQLPFTNCPVGPNGKSESSVTDCSAGSQNGFYSSGDVVNIQASVPTDAYNRGWRFLKFVDSGAGGGQINCDPQGTTGDHLSANCQFQIFENLETNVYFDDLFGPTDVAILPGTNTPAAGSTTSSSSAAFDFNAPSDPDATYECKLDRPGTPGGYVACGGPADKSESYNDLTTTGSYTFAVRAKDPSGNIGSIAARTWNVDHTPPTTTINTGPSGDADHENPSPSFTFSSNEPNTTFTCRLTPGSTTGCTSGMTYTNLADGSYTFGVRGTDGVGNGGSEAVRTFVVDRNAPSGLQITDGPPSGTTSTSATFQFSASDTSTFHFTCQLGAGAVDSACTTGKTYADLDDGTYEFKLTAVDRYGHASLPVTRTWTVDRSVPDTTILSGPNEGSSTPSNDVSFTFASPESGASFECKVDSGAFAACSSPKSLNLTNGDHTFSVRAKDVAGNADSTPATRSFRVNSLDGDSDGINRPADCDDANPAIHPGATDTPGDGIDQDCSGADATVFTSPPTGTGTPVGTPNTPGGGGSQGEPVLTVAGTPSAKWKVKGATTLPTKLALAGLTPGATVDVKCKAPKRKRGCPKSASLPAPANGKLDLTKMFKKRKLPKGTVVTITIRKQGMTTRTITYTTRAGKQPTVKQKP